MVMGRLGKFCAEAWKAVAASNKLIAVRTNRSFMGVSWLLSKIKGAYQASKRWRISSGLSTCKGSAPPPGMPTCVALSSMDTMT